MNDMTRLTRRRALQGAASALAVVRRARAQSSYKGELVIVGQTQTLDRATPGLLKAFSDARPGLSIRQVLYPSDKFVALFTAGQAAGEQADMLLLNGQDLRRYAVNGTLRPLDELPYLDRFIPQALQTCRLNGKTWGLPVSSIGGFPLFVNRALLERVKMPEPKTYDDIKAISQALSAEGLRAFTHAGKNIYLWPVWFFTAYAQVSNNKSIERSQEMLLGHAKFTDPDVVRALDLVFRFARDRVIPTAVLSLDNNGAISDFMGAKAAFMMFSDALSHQIFLEKPPGVDLDIMLMPALYDGAGRSQFPGGPRLVLGIPQKVAPERLGVVRELADYLTADAQNDQIVKLNGGTVPCNRNVAPSDEPFVQKERNFEPQLSTYLDWYWPPEITRVFQEGIQAGIAGKAKPEEVAQNAQTTLDRLVRDGYSFSL
jgi:ABC-type glycerol-3-phosphate transport system substrate-binding protein